MKLKVKLYATLGEYLPAGAERNVANMDIPPDTSVATLIEQLHLPPELAHLVLVNGNFIPPGERATTTLSPGDEFAVWPPIAGG